jgi:rubredoxin
VSDDFLSSREWLDLRYKVLKKHKGWCRLCGHKGDPTNPIQVDHIKPRSTYPHLALVEENLQVLCRMCNVGKSNKDTTDWRNAPSRELMIQQSCDPAKRAKLQQLGYLKTSSDIDKSMRREADKQYRQLWREVEEDWLAQGAPA